MNRIPPELHQMMLDAFEDPGIVAEDLRIPGTVGRRNPTDRRRIHDSFMNDMFGFFIFAL